MSQCHFWLSLYALVRRTICTCDSILSDFALVFVIFSLCSSLLAFLPLTLCFVCDVPATLCFVCDVVPVTLCLPHYSCLTSPLLSFTWRVVLLSWCADIAHLLLPSIFWHCNVILGQYQQLEARDTEQTLEHLPISDVLRKEQNFINIFCDVCAWFLLFCILFCVYKYVS